jgi:DNA helicase HerA-like ATPase
MDPNSTTDDSATPNAWPAIGTVVGDAGTAEFTFILRQFQARMGDIVTLRMDAPDGQSGDQRSIYVWARVSNIRRFNPFFPFEAGQELAAEGISLESTVLANTRDQLEAEALVLGYTTDSDLTQLFPLTYPIKPATTVRHPPAAAVRQLLIGNVAEERRITVGSLIARNDVEVTLSASKLVSRHLAILAMTGGGKTVAARRIIRELIRQGYPLLILDPHGDYIGLAKCQDTLQKESPGCVIKLFYPDLLMQADGEQLVTQLVSQMTSGLTESQSSYLQVLYERLHARTGEPAFEYIERLIHQVGDDFEANAPPRGLQGNSNWKGTIGAVRRNLRIVSSKLQRMRDTSRQMRRSTKLSGLPFEPLPNPFALPDRIIRPGQVSILYLAGYDHITQCSITAITLETLFEFRASLSDRIPPFFTVVEEAHTFIPSAREGTENAVSLPVIRRIITEGRKFGTGLMLISQRPSRLDETIVSQCNSFLILRLVNPKDQSTVRSMMENLTDSDARMIPGFGPGQGIVSGQVVRFPLAVQVGMDQDLVPAEIGDEDFFEQMEAWTPHTQTPERDANEQAMEAIEARRRGSTKKRRKR